MKFTADKALMLRPSCMEVFALNSNSPGICRSERTSSKMRHALKDLRQGRTLNVGQIDVAGALSSKNNISMVYSHFKDTSRNGDLRMNTDIYVPL